MIAGSVEGKLAQIIIIEQKGGITSEMILSFPSLLLSTIFVSLFSLLPFADSFLNRNHIYFNCRQRDHVLASTRSVNAHFLSSSRRSNNFPRSYMADQSFYSFKRNNENILFKFPFILRSIIPTLASFLCILLPRKVFAAATTAASRAGEVLHFNGWDIYGRVPYDDFLFSSWKLTEPNLLRRTLQEAVINLQKRIEEYVNILI